MTKEKVLIVGAGEAGQELAAEIKKHLAKYEIVGFLDDNQKLIGEKMLGFTVLGETRQLSSFIKKLGISQVFIAIPSAQGNLIRRVIGSCEKEKVIFKIVPRLLEIVEGKVRLSQVKEIEVEDLLGRAIVQVDQQILNKEFVDKSVLVTGAAGSIGSEICRQILEFRPKKLIALDCWESGLYNLELSLSHLIQKDNFVSVVASIRDYSNIKQIIKKYRTAIIFHAAAYKHVPLMQEFPLEAIKNNVIGTENLVKAASLAGVGKVVNISTDKAVNPTSVMGTTKLLAELIAKSYNSSGSTKFSSVRFGNVLGSQGSVVPTFQRQIAEGGPVTVTDKRMTRFFMTIPEAVQLVLNASLLIRDGGETFMLDMGEPVKIDELARLMIRLAGYVPEVDIKIKYTGVRSGEKLSEKLTAGNERTEKTSHDGIFVVKGGRKELNLKLILTKLKKFAAKNNQQKCLDILREIAPNLK